MRPFFSEIRKYVLSRDDIGQADAGWEIGRYGDGCVRWTVDGVTGHGRGDCSINHDFQATILRLDSPVRLRTSKTEPRCRWTPHTARQSLSSAIFKKALVTSLLRNQAPKNRTAPTGPVGVWGGVRCSWLSNDRIESRSRLRIKLRWAETNTRIHASSYWSAHNGHNAYFPAYIHQAGGRNRLFATAKQSPKSGCPLW